MTYPYEVLPKISEFILELGKTLPADKFECREDNIWIAKSASVAPSAYIHGPAIIDEEHLSEEMPLLEKAQLLEIQPS